MSTGEKDSSEVLGFLQEKGDIYSKLALSERKRESDLADALEHITKETENYRVMAKKKAIDVMNLHITTKKPAYQRADGNDIGRQAQQATTKVLNILEVKLNKLLQHKSQVVNRNKQLKQEIDHYRRMRMQTDVTHAKFNENLTALKEEIEKILSESAIVVEERERIVKEKDNLERTNAEEQRVFSEEYETYGKFIKEQNTSLEEALLKERKADQKTKKHNELDQNPHNGDMTLEEEVQMAQQVGSLREIMDTEQISLSTIQDRIRSYEVMFEQLKKMTGTNSLEEVVSNYVAHEEEMFSLYNFIQAVNAEIDLVVETDNQIGMDIDYFKHEQDLKDKQRRNILDSLKHKLESTLETTRACEEQNKQFSDGVGQVSKKVFSLFIKLGCDNDTRGTQNQAAGKSLASKGVAASRQENKFTSLSNQGVGEGNVLECMGYIEQRMVDIISAYLRVTNGDSGSNNSISSAAGPHLAPPLRSPGTGPVTPMHWTADPLVDVNELSEDELLDGSDAGEPDSKPIDLNTYKDRLQRKLGLTSAGGTANSSRGHGGAGSAPKGHSSSVLASSPFPKKHK